MRSKPRAKTLAFFCPPHPWGFGGSYFTMLKFGFTEVREIEGKLWVSRRMLTFEHFVLAITSGREALG